MVQVELYATQLGFLDRVVNEAQFGSSRDEVLRTILVEHVNDRLAGVPEYVGGRAVDDVLEADFPTYGSSADRRVLEPVTGAAVPVHRGQVLRIEQLVGGQCVDFNAFNLHDYKEFLDCGFTRSFQSFDPGAGEFIWTNSPRARPMFAILRIPETCELDIVGHRCNRVYQELGWGEPRHPNCQDTMAEAAREYGLTPDDIHDSFNLWMATTIDENGRRQFKWNPARKGDRLELLALFDIVTVSAICGLGDLVGINNYTFAPVRVETLDATPSTTALTDAIGSRWGNLESQMNPGHPDFIQKDVLATRALTRDPTYEPNYLQVPAITICEVDLTADQQHLVAGLQETGVYGNSAAEVLRAAFMRWCNWNLTCIRRAKLHLRE